MGAKAEALAKQFEAKVQEATTVLEKLSDADWKQTTTAEKWTRPLRQAARARGHRIRGGARHELGAARDARAHQSHRRAFRQHSKDGRRLSYPSARVRKESWR